MGGDFFGVMGVLLQVRVEQRLVDKQSIVLPFCVCLMEPMSKCGIFGVVRVRVVSLKTVYKRRQAMLQAQYCVQSTARARISVE